MPADLGLNYDDLEKLFAAELLQMGPSMAEASSMARKLASAFHARFQGKRVTFHLRQKHYRVLTPEERKRIFLEWFLGDKEEHVICTEREICRRTLERIKRQGRSEDWAGRRG